MAGEGTKKVIGKSFLMKKTRLNWVVYGGENIVTKIAARDFSALAGNCRVA